MKENYTYDLAAALKEMVREGMKPHLVAVRLALAALLGIEAAAECSPRSQRERVGGMIVDEFLRRLDLMRGTYIFDGVERDAAQIRTAALILFKLGSPLFNSPDDRRRAVMGLFGIYVSASTWSHHGLEYAFCRLLAGALVECDRDKAVLH